MKLAILHYHLNRGGVTQVVANHLRSLAAVDDNPFDEVTVIYGGRRAGWPEQLRGEIGDIDLTLVEVAALEYEDERPSDNLETDLIEALEREELFPDNCLIHIHNHSLGKNRQLPQVIAILSRRGYRQLLQIHDFAEDFRPGNYQLVTESLPEHESSETSWLYPQAAHIHYATLNRRDHGLMSQAGVDAQRLHYLPNPVGSFPQLPSRKAARDKLASKFDVPVETRMVLYPVRAIRRKNIGELLLWSAATPDSYFGITLDPLNPAEVPTFDRWRQTIRDLDLPVVTGLGEPGGLSFTENVTAADAFITTSVAEGFGMVFLESWLAGCPLIGRDLPEITADFREAGITFDGLAPRIDIPVEWIRDFGGLRQAYRDATNASLRSFGRTELSLNEAEDAFEKMLMKGCMDFASLDIPRQIDIIDRIRKQPSARSRLWEQNAVISEAASFDRKNCQEMVTRNAEKTLAYSFGQSGERLLKIYARLLDCERDSVQPLPNAHRVLDRLLDPTRLQLIRLPS